MSEKQRFKSSIKLSKDAFDYYKDRAEKEFIINSLCELPIDKLKQFISFEVINPYDKSIPKSIEDAEHRHRLLEERVIEFRMEILI